MKNRRRTLYRPSLSQSKSAVDIFKPKSISGNKENEKEPKGCDASFETLKKREQTKNKKVVRLSEVFSLMELNQSDKSSNNASNEQTENNEDDGLTLASSLTDVTNDNDLRSNRMLSATSFFNTTYDDTTRHFNPSLTLNKTNLNSIPSRSFVQTQLKLGTFKTTKNNEFKEIYRPIVLEKENKFENSQSQTKKRFNVTYTNLTKMQLKLLKRVFSEKFAQSSQFDKFMDLTTTHVIIGNKVSPETVLNSKLTLAILKNCQIITFDWIIQSSQSKEWLKECYFTPEGYQDLIDKLNELRYEQKQLELFNEFDIFISNTNCKQIVREQLSEIIIKCCGHVTSRPNRSNLIIIEEKDYDEDLLANELKCLRNKEIAVVDSKWIYSMLNKNFKFYYITNFIFFFFKNRFGYIN